MSIRRVATGEDAEGKSHVVSDVVLETAKIDGLFEAVVVWAGDAPPNFPLRGDPPDCPAFYPPFGGYRFVVFTVHPEARASAAVARLGPEGMAKAAQEMERKIGAGFFSKMEPNEFGMHTTDTVDFEVVLSGEICLELDDGEEIRLKAGDTFVQNGTRHRWRNRSDTPATIAVVLIGGR